MAKKIILASGKGGVGKSSLTAGLAIALCDLGFNTLVVDFDIGMGCLDLILAADDTGIFNWGDVINGICEPMTALRSTIGPMLLVAPTSNDDSYTADSIKEMIKNTIINSITYFLMLPQVSAEDSVLPRNVPTRELLFPHPTRSAYASVSMQVISCIQWELKTSALLSTDSIRSLQLRVTTSMSTRLLMLRFYSLSVLCPRTESSHTVLLRVCRHLQSPRQKPLSVVLQSDLWE